MNGATVRVLAPLANVYTPPKVQPPRPASLQGLRPGILENSKANAQLLMERMVEGLRQRADLGVLTIGHKGVTLPPSSATLAQLKKECDFVLVGTGDCGSCTAWTVRAAVMLEEAGVPVVAVGTRVFEEQFHKEASQLGMPGLRCLFVEHPLGGLRESAVRTRAESAIEGLERALVAKD